ncbi:MAG: acetyl-CoA carboxylase [Thermodesulfobacteriota bacterium]|nr:acetyl-CoA carboxylase [Thermodesulfobacteriota bacterium]
METEKKMYIILSPLSGTFYRRFSPEEDPCVEVGDKVEPGMVVCIVESMKVFNDVRAEKAGIVKNILVENEEAIIIHQPLMEIEPI